MKDHSIKLALLATLADGEFYSGEWLGSQFGISRAAISKHIKGIQAWGVDIFRVQGKGYQLAQPMDLLNQEHIQQQVSNPLFVYPVIDSTNQFLLDRVGELESGSVCLAEHQEQGRGRRGRVWYSPFGTNLYLSMYWKLEAGMAAAMGLSLVVGMAVIDALESLGIQGVKVKWPNDLYYQDKKLAGILVEMSGQADGPANLVIGMGMNLVMVKESEDKVGQPWISLSEVIGHNKVDRNRLAIAFIDAWTQTLRDYQLSGMGNFVERWKRLDNFIDRPIKLIMGNREICGIDRGINETGAVLLETENGIEAFIGGEISLRSNE